MNDKEFRAAVERLEGDRTGQFGVKVAREAIRRLDEYEAVLRQIGWLNPGDKMLLTLLLTRTQFKEIADAIKVCDTGRDETSTPEGTIAEICAEFCEHHRRLVNEFNSNL